MSEMFLFADFFYFHVTYFLLSVDVLLHVFCLFSLSSSSSSSYYCNFAIETFMFTSCVPFKTLFILERAGV